MELIVININICTYFLQDWNSIVKLTENDSFIAALEGHNYSRSSSYHTTSDCSTWWTDSIERNSLDADSLDQELPTMDLLSGIVSSANVSFEETKQSFHSPEPEVSESTISSLILLPPPLPRKTSYDSQVDNNVGSYEDDSKSASSVDILEHVDVHSDSAFSIDKLSPSFCRNENYLAEVTSGIEHTKHCDLSYYYQNVITKQSFKSCL